MLKRRWRELVVVAFVAGVAAAAWAWPARRNYLFKREGVEQRLDVPYVAGVRDPKRELDLYLPGASRTTPIPAVVFVHGGYWTPFDRRWLQPVLGTFGNVGVAFAARGVAAAVISYRQHPLIQRGDDSLADIAAAVAFVRASCPAWGCDPARVFVIGHSAGGHLVSLLALDGRALRAAGVPPDSIAGYASIDGLFDLPAALPALKPAEAAVMRRLFGPDDASLAARSPITYARAQHPSLLFIDSTDDMELCRDSFRAMRGAMRKVRSPARFVELPGLGHNEAVIHIGMDDDTVLPVLLDYVRGAGSVRAAHSSP